MGPFNRAANWVLNLRKDLQPLEELLNLEPYNFYRYDMNFGCEAAILDVLCVSKAPLKML